MQSCPGDGLEWQGPAQFGESTGGGEIKRRCAPVGRHSGPRGGGEMGKQHPSSLKLPGVRELSTQQQGEEEEEAALPSHPSGRVPSARSGVRRRQGLSPGDPKQRQQRWVLRARGGERRKPPRAPAERGPVPVRLTPVRSGARRNAGPLPSRCAPCANRNSLGSLRQEPCRPAGTSRTASPGLLVPFPGGSLRLSPPSPPSATNRSGKAAVSQFIPRGGSTRGCR